MTRKLVAFSDGESSGQLWDRHFGSKLADFAHDDHVNVVAVDPNLEQTAVSVSDDMTVRIWRSREVMSNYKKSLKK